MHIAHQWPNAQEDELLAGNIATAPIDTADRALLRERNISLTRKQVARSVTWDVVVIHAIGTIEELDRTTNALHKRLREWCKLHWPGLERKEDFIDAVDPNAPAEEGIGAPLDDAQREALRTQIETVRALHAQRERMRAYLEDQLRTNAPNLTHVATAMIGAKLIALAGSHKRLSMMPAGTIQLLGAETALFRHLRDRRAKPPKHGIIFNHPVLQRSRSRGRVARVLADTIAIATKIDYFKGEFMGEELARKVEDAA